MGKKEVAKQKAKELMETAERIVIKTDVPITVEDLLKAPKKDSEKKNE